MGGGAAVYGSGGLTYYRHVDWLGSSRPDPLGLGAVDVRNPQSWNRYGYVGGNPLGSVDPSGEFAEKFGPDDAWSSYINWLLRQQLLSGGGGGAPGGGGGNKKKGPTFTKAFCQAVNTCLVA